MDKIEWMGVITTFALVVLSLASYGSGLKLIVIGWTALLAMLSGGLAAMKSRGSPRSVAWAHGVAGGAALSSVLFFILPQAISLSPQIGAAGILAGFLSGLALHSLSHRLSHSSRGLNTLWSVSIHSAAAGIVIGLIYQQLPSVTVLLGIAIISHKLPAGYMIGDRLGREGRFYWLCLLLPASAVGTLALLSFNYPLALSQSMKALFFGFSTGIFLHVALDFLPEPEPESHLRKLLHREEDPIHEELDEIRVHSVLSTIAGAAVVAVLALLL